VRSTASCRSPTHPRRSSGSCASCWTREPLGPGGARSRGVDGGGSGHRTRRRAAQVLGSQGLRGVSARRQVVAKAWLAASRGPRP
jgi:hypothetical protein